MHSYDRPFSATTLMVTLPGVFAAAFQVTQDFLEDDDRRAGFLVLAGMLGSFLFIRTSTRLIRNPKVTWWPGNVETGSGLHIHHLVFGIFAMMVFGFLGFAIEPQSPWSELFAVLFGVGAGLTLDEFALWLYLEDVYWSEQGRDSVDAVIIMAALGGLVVVGLSPFDVKDADGSSTAIVLGVAWTLMWSVIAALKGKQFLALIGLFVPGVAIVAAIRLGHPGSPWAHWFYKLGSDRARRAEERHRRYTGRKDRWLDRIGGKPSEPTKTP
jgi:hypothetical protein